MQKILSHMRKAIEEYHMIDEGDKIAICLSGGKDSITMLKAFKNLQIFYPKKFDIIAVSINPGFDFFDIDFLKNICQEVDVPLFIENSNAKEIVFDIRKEKNPCSLCAKMRKGALNDAAEKLGCNKVALGHNKDDVIETFFMSLFYEGRINTFAPVSYLDRKKLYSIRPLMYVPEYEAKSFVTKSGINIVKNPCLVDGNTKRQETKEFIASISKNYDNLPEKVFGAIQRSYLKGWEKPEKK